MSESPVPPSSSAPAARKPRRWRRRLIWLAVLLVAFVVCAPLLIGLAPVRDRIAAAAGEQLGRTVEIGSSGAFWGRGIDLEDVTVHSPDGFDGPLATVRKIHVDVDVLALLGGSIAAQVRVVEPHVTLRTDPTGRGNEDGVVERLTTPDEDAPETEAPPLDLEVSVIGGRFESQALEAAGNDVVEDIQVTLALDPAGGVQADARAVVKGAGKDGADAPLTLTAELDADGAGPVRCTAPPLDLARVARVVESATGIRDLRGSLSLDVDARMHANRTADGTFRIDAENVSAVSPEAARLTVRRVNARGKLRSVQQATEADLQVRVGDVRVQERRGPAHVPYRETFREPAVTLLVQGRYDPTDGLVRIASGSLDAGGTASLAAKGPIRVETDPTVRIQGTAEGRLDLRRLGDLRPLVPALEPLAGGVLTMNVVGRGGAGLDVGCGMGIRGLRIRPSEAVPAGYAEDRISLAFNARHEEKEGTRIALHRLESRLVRGSFAEGAGLTLRLDPAGRLGLEGAFDLRVDLPSVSQLAGGALGLERGERIEGTLLVKGSGRGTEEARQLEATVQARGVIVPPSWSDVRTRADLSAQLRVQGQGDETEVTVSGIRGMGLTGQATARLGTDGDETSLTQADAALRVDLTQARSWLGPLLDLTPRERLAGQLAATLRMEADGEERRLSSRTELTNLDWRRGGASPPVREPRIVLSANVQLAPEGGRHRAEELTLDAGGLRLDLTGSSYVAEPDADLDATLRMGGDAAKLAPLVSALLGEGYEDLRGRGPLRGELSLKGSPEDGGRSLLIEGDLGFGSWSSAGVVVQDARLSVRRPEAAAPLTAGFLARLNGGTARVDGRARLGGEQIPWSATAKVAQVDTSGVLVSRGLGRYLAFALPALLPAGKSTPVLSGLLDADLQGGAPSIDDPAMSDGLRGQGRVHMSGGEIKQSTLFGGGGGGGNFGKVVSMLKVAVPEAGRVLQDLSRAVTFSTLDSRFRVGNRVLTLEQAKLVGSSVHIDMQGRVDFEQRVALQSKVILQGGAGRALAKVLPDGAIPLKVTGTLEAPQVRPDVDMKKLAAGGLGGKLLEDLKKKLPGGIPNPFK